MLIKWATVHSPLFIAILPFLAEAATILYFSTPWLEAAGTEIPRSSLIRRFEGDWIMALPRRAQDRYLKIWREFRLWLAKARKSRDKLVDRENIEYVLYFQKSAFRPVNVSESLYFFSKATLSDTIHSP